MTHQLTIDRTDPPAVAALPHLAAPQEINVYSHSTLLYWWPAWAFGFVIALLNAGQEKFTAEGGQPSSAPGLTYLSILLLLIIFSNVRLRGINSVVALLTVAFIAVLLAWFGWWDDMACKPSLPGHGVVMLWSAAVTTARECLRSSKKAAAN
jgi:hypothetical protein